MKNTTNTDTHLVTQPLSPTDVMSMLKASKAAESERNPFIDSLNARIRMFSALFDATEASVIRYNKFGERLTAQNVYESLDATKEAFVALRGLHSEMLNDIANKSLPADSPLFAKLTTIVESLDNLSELRDNFREGAQKRLDTVNMVYGSSSKLDSWMDSIQIHLTDFPVKEAKAFMLGSARLEMMVEDLNMAIQKSSSSPSVKQYSNQTYDKTVKQLQAATVATRGVFLDSGLSAIILNSAGVVHDLNTFVTSLPDKINALKTSTTHRLNTILEQAGIFGRTAVKTVLEHLGENKEIRDNSANLHTTAKLCMELEKSREQTEKQMATLTKAMDGITVFIKKRLDAGTLTTELGHVANAKYAADANQLAKLRDDLEKITGKTGSLAAAAANISYYSELNNDLKDSHKPLLGKLGAAWKSMVDNIKNANKALENDFTVPSAPKRLGGPRS